MDAMTYHTGTIGPVCPICHGPLYNQGAGSYIIMGSTVFHDGCYHLQQQQNKMKGCICPPTSEQTCKNLLCPRK